MITELLKSAMKKRLMKTKKKEKKQNRSKVEDEEKDSPYAHIKTEEELLAAVDEIYRKRDDKEEGEAAA